MPFEMRDDEIMQYPGRITPLVASKYLGFDYSPRTVCIMLRNGTCPFGQAFHPDGRKQWMYIIDRRRLVEYKKGVIGC